MESVVATAAEEARPRDAAAPVRVPAGTPELLSLALEASRLLFLNAETTERTVDAASRVAHAFGWRVTVIPHWGDLVVKAEDGAGQRQSIAPVAPVAIDMNKVLATEQVVESVVDGRVDIEPARSALRGVATLPPVSLVRFAVAAAVGACALAVLFGARRPSTFPWIAFSAASGVLLRRWLSHVSPNLLAQPFGAALLAGLVGGVAQRDGFGAGLALIALCPCMVLVPGPHFLNGLVDLIRARVALGCARIAFACLVVAAISAGLLLGLWVTGGTLPLNPPSPPVPLLVDAVAAGLAVAAYASFYSMQWRFVPIPVVVGITAHAIRWSALASSATAFGAAFLACLFVGAVMSRVATRLRLPFAAMSYAAVVSLIPGVFLVRMASGMVHLADLGRNAPGELVTSIVMDAATATLILVSMGVGLILPRLLSSRSERPDPAERIHHV